MCNPIAFMAVGTAISAVSSISAGRFSEKIGEFNQASLNRQADDRVEAGKIEEQKVRAETTALKGEQKTAYAASGVDISSGSPVDVISDTAALGELDALTIRRNADVDAYNLRVQGVGERMQGQLAKRQGFGNAAGSILTTAGSIASL